MKIDIPFLAQLFGEHSFEIRDQSEEALSISLTPNTALLFENLGEDDSLFGIEDSDWHAHDRLVCCRLGDEQILIDIYDFPALLSRGELLIAELLRDGSMVRRKLVHAVHNDELRYLDVGDEIRFYRATPRKHQGEKEILATDQQTASE